MRMPGSTDRGSSAPSRPKPLPFIVEPPLRQRPLFDSGGALGSPCLPIDVPNTFPYGGAQVESIKRVESAPVTFLFPGHTTGGCCSTSMAIDQNARPKLTTGALVSRHREDRMCPAYFERNPEMVDKFENLISECCTAQKGTRKLYSRLVKQEKQLHRNVEVLQQKLKIMRSMPDLSMPRREFSLFVGNAMGQQRAMDREMADELAQFMGDNRVASIRHIFPLRRADGRIADNNSGDINWRYCQVPPPNLLTRVPGAPDPYEEFIGGKTL